MERPPVEYIELGDAERWAYLRRYYEAAAAFYGAKDRVVTDEEVRAKIAAFREKPQPRVRRRIPLERFRFRLDEGDEGVRGGWFGEAFRDDGWEEVAVPHSVNHVPKDPARFGRTRYRILAPEPGTTWDIWRGDYASWYRARLPVEAVGKDRVAWLSFDSVNLVTDVWVNETPVMMDHLGLFPFSMEVTEELDSRGATDALVALRVSNRATNMPYFFYNGAQLAYAHPPYTTHPFPVDTEDEAWSGIAGPASLQLMDRRHLQDVFITTESLTADRAVVRLRIEVRNESWQRFAGSVRVEAGRWLPDEEPLAPVGEAKVTVLPLNDAVVEVTVTVRDPRPWTPGSPALSLARVVLVDEQGRDIDDLVESFGIRTFRMEGSHFALNGARVVPRGTHDLSNYPGESLVCPRDETIVRDILLHKAMNATCSRWPSDMRMHYGRIADYADQLGYMISWTGYFEMWTVHPEMEMYARRDARAMVRSLRNHPSIVVWEMGDEPLMEIHPHRRFRWYDAIYDMVAAEDTSRPIIPAGFWCNELVDLVEKHPQKALPPAERRAQVLRDYPLFTKKLAPWDYHYCPYLATNAMAPTHGYVDQVKRNLGGERATVFTEFGIDGMPDFEKVKDYYGRFRWAGWGLMPVNRRSSDANYYGRSVGREDWRETQAAQALVLSGIITRLRSSPDVFAAFYLVTLVDPWTFHWGVVDACWNAKLAYFVARSCYAPVLLSGLHGTTKRQRAEGPLRVTASNIGAAVRGVLRARLLDDGGRAVADVEQRVGKIPGPGAVQEIAALDVAAVPAGLLTLELRLADDGGAEIASTLELFYLEDGAARP